MWLPLGYYFLTVFTGWLPNAHKKMTTLGVQDPHCLCKFIVYYSSQGSIFPKRMWCLPPILLCLPQPSVIITPPKVNGPLHSSSIHQSLHLRGAARKKHQFIFTWSFLCILFTLRTTYRLKILEIIFKSKDLQDNGNDYSWVHFMCRAHLKILEGFSCKPKNIFWAPRMCQALGKRKPQWLYLFSALCCPSLPTHSCKEARQELIAARFSPRDKSVPFLHFLLFFFSFSSHIRCCFVCERNSSGAKHMKVNKIHLP